MSPLMDEMLVNEIVPRLRNVARTIPKVGHEDDEETNQDCTLQAARMMDVAEKPAARSPRETPRISLPRPPATDAGFIKPVPLKASS